MNYERYPVFKLLHIRNAHAACSLDVCKETVRVIDAELERRKVLERKGGKRTLPQL